MNVKFIINPSSGKQIVQKSLDRIIGRLVLDKIIREVDIYYTINEEGTLNELKNIPQGKFDLIVAVGGDGTVNQVINGMVKYNVNIPLAILPSGTVNDFANWYKISNDGQSFINMIKNMKTAKIDLGKVGEKYFLNVAAGGMFTDVGYKASSDFKTTFGKYAYYVEGVKEIPKNLFNSIEVEIEYEEKKEKKEIFMFIVSNTPMVGGFKKVAPMAKTDDGLLDVCIIEKCDIKDFVTLFLQVIAGEHINHPKIMYLQSNKIRITPTSKNKDIILDLDGEKGERLPATILTIPKAIEVVIP
ncbi:MAG: YegS/Rv2252/BmrU family lipid kinase [Anaeromicrobium sp.]|jgi:diacylglycerol kinase (ATP)|uniref:diacylglycerol/lipid kinase family protein n=1 Tax=Anaeromicrobium sp. TaxID=1929132 RepID=UPI0025EB338F|nr:YegS/Rv2252/BmrU family lipid kinase [Anaeromicrobium sp.]MCT4596081.1 YegS/Rv2252/BmrU family lipid kinase [Anaeromicrobium sp.]